MDSKSLLCKWFRRFVYKSSLRIGLMSDCFFFFFQAEDGIRDLIVTGVQTCALPISAGSRIGRLAAVVEVIVMSPLAPTVYTLPPENDTAVLLIALVVESVYRVPRSRSEERRVGKEGRSRGAPDH